MIWMCSVAAKPLSTEFFMMWLSSSYSPECVWISEALVAKLQPETERKVELWFLSVADPQTHVWTWRIWGRLLLNNKTSRTLQGSESLYISQYMTYHLWFVVLRTWQQAQMKLTYYTLHSIPEKVLLILKSCFLMKLEKIINKTKPHTKAVYHEFVRMKCEKPAVVVLSNVFYGNNTEVSKSERTVEEGSVGEMQAVTIACSAKRTGGTYNAGKLFFCSYLFIFGLSSVVLTSSWTLTGCCLLFWQNSFFKPFAALTFCTHWGSSAG